MEQEYGISSYAQDQSRSFGQIAGSVVGAFANPLNYWLYNPGKYNITSGTVNHSAKISSGIIRNGAKLADTIVKQKFFFGGHTLGAWNGLNKFANILDKQGRISALLNGKSIEFGLNKTSAFSYTNRHNHIVKRFNSRNQTNPFLSKLDPILHEINTNNAEITKDKIAMSKLTKHSKQNARRVKALKLSISKREQIVTDLNVKSTSLVESINSWKPRQMKYIGKRKTILHMAMRGGTRSLIGLAKGASIIGAASIAWDIGGMIAEPVGRGIMNSIDHGMSSLQSLGKPEMGGALNMAYLSVGAATERQRALGAISRSQINGRSALGRESEFLHS